MKRARVDKVYRERAAIGQLPLDAERGLQGVGRQQIRRQLTDGLRNGEGLQLVQGRNSWKAAEDWLLRPAM